jgi:GTP:adenosylcobinamide-phosphate guanylyltransferase
MKKLVLVLSFLITQKVFSQNTDSSYNRSLHFKPFKGWYKNDMRLKSKELKNEFYKVPAAIPYYKKASTSKIVAYFSYAAMSTCYIIARSKNNQLSNKNYQAYQITGIAFGIASIITQLSSFRNFKKGAKTYNKTISMSY